MFKKMILLGLVFVAGQIKSQMIKKTVGNYSSELAVKEITGRSLVTKITYYTNSGSLTIDDNLALIRYNDIGADTSKTLKDKIIPFKFQTNIQGNLYQIFKDNKYANLIRTEGTLTINGISKECVAFYAPILLNTTTNELYLDFNLKFNLSDFNVNEPALLLKDLVEFEIEDGYVTKID